MTASKKTPTETWQRLLTSHDLMGDLRALYPTGIANEIARLMGSDTTGAALTEGILDTARAYVEGQQDKAADGSEMLKFSGVHMIGAGLAARRLAYALQQIAKSEVATTMLHERLADKLDQNPSHGQETNAWARRTFGPAVHLSYLQEIATALEAAAGDIITLPEKDENEADTKPHALAFVEDFNAQPDQGRKTLPAHHALEQAARTFRTTWEEHSIVPYIRGRYRHERGGYDSFPARALHLIISKLDSKVTESGCGTSIENVRERSTF